jgi:VanZ family protein
MKPKPVASRPLLLRTAALIAAAIGLLALWHFGVIESSNRLVRALHSSAHFPVFGALAAVIFALLRLHGRGHAARGNGTYVAAFLAMIVLSLATEGLQTQLPAREGSLRDVLVNLLGAATALALLRLREDPIGRRVRLLLWAWVVTATLVVALPLAALGAAYTKRTMDFPTLLRFNLALDRLHVLPANARLSREALPAAFREPGDARSLCVTLGTASFPGITIPDPMPDWRGYEALELDLTNVGQAPLRLSLRIDDVLHDGRREDRFNGRIVLPAQARQRIHIPLASIRDAPEGRPLELDGIARMLLFARADDQGRQFCLTRIRLVGPADDSNP